jgi:hypothetical protein
MEPKPDAEFFSRLKDAFDGSLPVYSALLPAASIIPFDLRFRLDRHPDGVAAIQTCIDSWRSGQPSTLTVYPCGSWFVAAGDYAPLFAALWTRLEYIPCWVLGPVDSPFARDVQGPLNHDQLKPWPYAKLRPARARRSRSRGSGISALCL